MWFRLERDDLSMFTSDIPTPLREVLLPVSPINSMCYFLQASECSVLVHDCLFTSILTVQWKQRDPKQSPLCTEEML